MTDEFDPANVTALDARIESFVPVHTSPTISCCQCGQQMSSKGGMAMCTDCIRLQVDITEDVQKQGTITFCKNCSRLLVPPNIWILAPRESRELLGACLKRLRGLSKLRLIDAQYVWTEPHSRRTKIRIKVQGEVERFQGLLVEQSFVAEFYEATHQCPDCAKSFTPNKWRASIQIRQKVEHKKTFFYLEQLILKNKAHKDTISIEESREGLNLFYSQRNHAEKMLEFLTSVVPCKYKKSSEMISENIHTSEKRYKFSYSVEIVPICKEDLVVLPKKLARSLGNIRQMVLCSGIGNTVHLLDPTNLQTTELAPSKYWQEPFQSLASAKELTEFMILDIEPAGPATDKWALADATVARLADLGNNDAKYYVRTHLGGILHSGDLAYGYFLTNSNFNNDLWDTLNPEQIPDVILVKKSYSDKPRKKARNWKLKRMAKEYSDVEARPSTREGKKGAVSGLERNAADYEEFMRELEEDPEFRNDINMYKVDGEDDDGEVDDDEELEIALDELRVDDGETDFSDDESDSEREHDQEEFMDPEDGQVVKK